MDIRKGTDTGNLLTDTGVAGGIDMVFVKVREVYDLHTVQNKMTVIGIHTPKPDIIKANFPGLLMQCKAYRPYSCDVRVACASQQALDPLGVGTGEGDVAPEDLFNPILYKAISNVGMSQLEARIVGMSTSGGVGSDSVDVDGQSAAVDMDTLTNVTDEFPVYYGLLSNAHGWRTADPQAGLVMTGLKPYVFELLYNVGDMSSAPGGGSTGAGAPNPDGTAGTLPFQAMRGNAKPIPFMNCTSYTDNTVQPGFIVGNANDASKQVRNAETNVPWINCVVGAIIVPPSRLHELFYRMVIEWTIEFTQVRPIGEITNFAGLGVIADLAHYKSYDFASTKQALGVNTEIMDKDQTMVSANVDINKVM